MKHPTRRTNHTRTLEEVGVTFSRVIAAEAVTVTGIQRGEERRGEEEGHEVTGD